MTTKKAGKKRLAKHDPTVYSYHSIVKRQTAVIPMILLKLFRLNWFRRLFFSVPAVDEAVVFKNGDKNGNGANSINAELELGFIGAFKHNWDINNWIVDALLRLPVKFNSVHGVYFPETYKPFLFFKRLIFDLTEPTEISKKALRNQLEVLIRLAESKKRKVIVFHPIPFKLGKKENEVIKGIVALIKPFLPMLEDFNIFIAIENMPKLRAPRQEYFPMTGSVAFFERLMDAINHKHVGITFDWGHANSFARFMYMEELEEPGFTFTPETLATFEYQKFFLRKLKPKIYHLHLNYNEAHKLKRKPPRFMFTNFDTHQELTKMGYFEYERYKEALKIVLDSPHLISATLELLPRTLWPAKSYEESVKIFKAMLK